MAEAYLKYLYSEEGQRIAGQNFYRPTDAKVAGEFAKQFPKLELFTIDQAFGGWAAADKVHLPTAAASTRSTPRSKHSAAAGRHQSQQKGAGYEQFLEPSEAVFLERGSDECAPAAAGVGGFVG